MGNTRSIYEDEQYDDIWWPAKYVTNHSNKENQNIPTEIENEISVTYLAANSELPGPSKQLSIENQEKLNEFKLELERKHEKRREIIAEKRKDMENLREEIIKLRKENDDLRNVRSKEADIAVDDSTNFEIEQLRAENEELRKSIIELNENLANKNDLCETNRELKKNIAEMQSDVQRLNTEVLNFESERNDYETHVVALKDVIKVSKQMLLIREGQLNELREKVQQIEAALAGKEMTVLSQDLRCEYERQLQSIRNLKALYEERQRADKIEKAELNTVLDAVKIELEGEKKKNSELESRIEELDNDNSKKYDEIKHLESNLGLTKAECRQYQAELTVINQLFSEILLGFNNNQEVDLDKLIKLLEENHNLLQNIVVNEISNEVSSALPKLVLDLVNQINDDQIEIIEENSEQNDESPQTQINEPGYKLETIVEETETQTSSLHQLNSPAEIVEILPKVWRVLIELLSHQSAPVNVLTEDTVQNSENPCYKLVETPKGPNLVVSVSQTFIRLKDLILEKKSLEKDLGHLKHLNTHLETRLQDQEKRLELVSKELSKTWHVVGKLQKQHQVLHTQEQILRYELAQKRKLLNTLKEELEYSREKWSQAREKNSNTEKQWKQLRHEFASRKTTVKDDSNNSVESGYSDERDCSSSDDEPGYETDISECNQKISCCEDNNGIESPVEDSIKDEESPVENSEILGSDNNDDVIPENTTILDVIQTEIDEIVTNDLDNSNSTSDNNEENVHSHIKPTKTDKVQIESNEKTTNIKEEKSIHDNEQPSTSQTEDISRNDIECPTENKDVPCCISNAAAGETECKPKRTLEEVLKARDERLKRMESQCQKLVTQVTNTSNRSVAICNQLEDLHAVYGESSVSNTAPEPSLDLNRTTETELLDDTTNSNNENQE